MATTLDAKTGIQKIGGIAVDTSFFPLVVIEMPKHPLTDAEVDGMIAALTAILRRREKHLVLIDGLDIELGINPKQRKSFTDFASNAEMRELSRFKLADVLLLSSAILRGAMTAVFWIAPPVSPTKPFATIDEALPFVRERLQAGGLTSTPAMEARLSKLRRK